MTSADNKTENKNSRRQFLKFTALGIGLASFTRLFEAKAQAPKAGATPAMVAESDPLAKSLGYYEDAKKVDTKKWPKRAGAAGGKQYCYNCQFYQAKADHKKTVAAPCTIFAGKSVKGQGWCNSWVQNPTVKD